MIFESLKKTSRQYRSEQTVVEIGNVKIGGGSFAVMAGPCAVEGEEQLLQTAQLVKCCGADILRAGAFKPRTSPYSFQGLGRDGLRLLRQVREQTGLPVISEITDEAMLPFYEDIDLLQIGARNMQNFSLLKAVGKSGKPVMLKRGFGAKVEELLLSAEYILAQGNENVILCERGIRTFEDSTRFTLDVTAIEVIHAVSHLPVVADPSHACGRRELVPSLALACTAAGADGIIMEVHPRPDHALSDAEQAITPDELSVVCRKMKEIRQIL